VVELEGDSITAQIRTIATQTATGDLDGFNFELVLISDQLNSGKAPEDMELNDLPSPRKNATSDIFTKSA
jgi:hypothetical protein